MASTIPATAASVAGSVGETPYNMPDKTRPDTADSARPQTQARPTTRSLLPEELPDDLASRARRAPGASRLRAGAG